MGRAPASSALPIHQKPGRSALWNWPPGLTGFPYCPQVSEGPMLVLQPASGLHFPAIETLREALLSRALESTWPHGLQSPPAPHHLLCTQPGSCWTPDPALNCQEGACLPLGPGSLRHFRILSSETPTPAVCMQ